MDNKVWACRHEALLGRVLLVCAVAVPYEPVSRVLRGR